MAVVDDVVNAEFVMMLAAVVTHIVFVLLARLLSYAAMADEHTLKDAQELLRVL
jgi:hypothetical protein